MPDSTRQQAFQPAAGYTSDPDLKEGEVAVNTNMSPRDIALQAIEEKAEEAHTAQVKEDAEADPGIKMLQDQMQAGQDASHAQAIIDGKLPPPEQKLDPDGAQYREAMHPERPQPPDALPEKPAAAEVPTELQDDPLAEHIVMDGEQPMFALKVNGENMLMPLAEARRRLQIGTAAEIRMQNAASKEKQVDERERTLQAGESALAARMQLPPAQPETLSVSGVLDEKEIQAPATEVFKTAFSGSEEDAAEKLTQLLIATRTPQAPIAAPVDEAALVNRAAHAAVGVMTAVDLKKDLIKGITAFEDKYPAIMGDVHLYRMADGMTDDIAVEHPEWLKSQVILESGKRTSEWSENLKAPAEIILKDDDPATLSDEKIPELSQPPTQNRQERKRTLVQIPQVTIATKPAEEPEAPPQTPQQALDELRRSRGQAV